MRKFQPIRDERVIDGMKEYFYIRSMRNYLFFCMGIYSGLEGIRLAESQGMANQRHSYKYG